MVLYGEKMLYIAEWRKLSWLWLESCKYMMGSDRRLLE
jgi:hypothetical protein